MTDAEFERCRRGLVLAVRHQNRPLAEWLLRRMKNHVDEMVDVEVEQGVAALEDWLRAYDGD